MVIAPSPLVPTAPWTDSFGRRHTYLRVSITDRCNFRCGYCMPAEGVNWRPRTEILSFEEIERLVRLFVRGGVTKVRLTGGEPTVRKDLEELIERLARIEGLGEVWMTTNGSTLAKKADAYRTAGLKGLNVSLDSLRRARFAEITRRDELPKVLDGIDAALAAGFRPLKINVVVMAGVNEDELLDFADFAVDRPVQVRFIEFMPFKGNEWQRGDLYPAAQMREDLRTRYRLAPLTVGPNAVAREFAIEGGKGSVAFVASMTESFCEGCNRLRLTADGMVKSCLFLRADGNLRDPLRTGADDETLARIVRDSLARKWKEHPPMENLLSTNDRSMLEIGG
ncbi:MAG: GTP 3',8-cyclase MoaA [Fimbriimonadaceae bacterium]|nr:GTP 3',8-cyclase MoaA [Fimbriimonadaceae bacterium]